MFYQDGSKIFAIDLVRFGPNSKLFLAMVVKVTVILSSRKFNYTPFTYQKILVNFPQFKERKSN